MEFIETYLKGSYIIKIERSEDVRGFFVRTFDIKVFKDHGMYFDIVQTSLSYNKNKGTIRGIHYQEKPYQESKLVQCIRGSIYDVIIDLREDSQTKGKWISVILSEEDYNILYIPKGFAHGFQTLEDNTLILYYMDEFYHPECANTIYYKSPEFNIKWICDNPIMSNKDISIDEKLKNCIRFHKGDKDICASKIG